MTNLFDINPESWMTRATCAHVDGNLWFPEGKSAGRTAAYAIKTCRSCPVLVECGELAAKIRPTHGVWAGRRWDRPPSHQPRGDRINRQHLRGIRAGS